MKDFRITIFIVCAVFWGTSELANAACDQTLNPGANVASVVAAAAAGSTICLNSGHYETIQFISFTKSPRVTVRSVTPLGATMFLRIYSNVNGLTVDGINFTGGLTIGAAGSSDGADNRNITVQNSALGTQQLFLSTAGFNNNNLLFDHNTFGQFNAMGGFEGRFQITGLAATPSGVTVTNNTFGPGGCSDGLNVGSRGVVIGPGNTFIDVTPSLICDAIYGGRANSPHIDAIQGYGQRQTTITGNYFSGNHIDVGIYDGGENEVITNNVFINSGEGSSCGDCAGSTWTHNTVTRGMWGINGKTLSGSNALVRDNIFLGSSGFTFNQNGTLGCTSNCIATHNLFKSSGSGTNNLIGTPTFTGGASPATWAGWQLATGSLGMKAGTDGQDMGTTYYGSVTNATAPPAPQKMKVLP